MAQKRKAEREKGVVSFNYIGFYVKWNNQLREEPSTLTG